MTRRINLYDMAAWQCYTIALLVTAVVAGAGWYVGRDRPVPGWFETVLRPVLGWFVLLVLAGRCVEWVVKKARRERAAITDTKPGERSDHAGE
jgi:hypothetical protein